ncbi:NAD(P)-dependent oxidoreductase [Actinoplanes subtropicus]|uniref:NAD(P)-dependent oxidoreductase n=1 Tax=Actinoplanes subtropicus TaxID=543632 RepID=UPI0004C45AC2
MSYREPALPRFRPLASSCSPAVATTGFTIYGCSPAEAVLFDELAPRFGVLPTITAAPVSAANAELALGNRCVSVGRDAHVAKGTLRALRRVGVRYVSTRSVGYDHIDVGYAESVGITVGDVGYSPDGVADYTVMLMLMTLRHARSVVRRMDAHDYRLNDLRGRELRDLTVGVIGTGGVGSAVMDRLWGFGCLVLAHDDCPAAYAHYVPLDDLLRQSDIVTIHTPLTPATRHLLDARRIAQMKPGAVVINTGRGALLDTEALVLALDSGQLGGAALDVPEYESPVLSRLREMPNVLISPRVAHHTDRALSDTVENSLLNCVDFESGRHPRQG